MRFMMIVKASKDSEAGKMPDEEILNAMGKYNEELMKAGVLVDLAGLQSTAKGARIRREDDGHRRSFRGDPGADRGLLDYQREVEGRSYRLGEAHPRSSW